jgi:hypothetical protein
VSRTLHIQLPDDIYRELEHEAMRCGKSVEQIAIDRVAETHSPLSRGSVDAMGPYFGAWQMSSEERSRIEALLDAERHGE